MWGGGGRVVANGKSAPGAEVRFLTQKPQWRHWKTAPNTRIFTGWNRSSAPWVPKFDIEVPKFEQLLPQGRERGVGCGVVAEVMFQRRSVRFVLGAFLAEPIDLVS